MVTEHWVSCDFISHFIMVVIHVYGMMWAISTALCHLLRIGYNVNREVGVDTRHDISKHKELIKKINQVVCSK